MPQTVTYEILDEPDGRFGVVATMGSDRIYRRDNLSTLAEAQEWIEGLRVLMAACGAPVVETGGGAGKGARTGRSTATSGPRADPSLRRHALDMASRRGERGVG